MKRFAALVLTAALLTGCGGKPAAKPSVPAPAPPPAPAAPVPDRRSLTLDGLRTELEQYMNAEGNATPPERLGALLESWGLRAGDNGGVAVTPMVKADLNGDGAPELIAVLNVWGELHSNPAGAVFVISAQGGRLRVDRSDSPPQPYVDGVGLMGATDLTGDGKPEIVWVAGDHGAHTSTTRVLVSRWQPGAVANLPGDMVTTMARVRIEGEEIVTVGGTVGSAGAGLTQRAAELRYRWNDREFVLVDRRFAPSEFGYHLLVDGINAESFQLVTDAQEYYRSVLEPGRPALPPEHVPPERQERFGQAVTEFARFRLGKVLQRRGQQARAQEVLAGATGPYAGLSGTLARSGDCQAAVTWGDDHPEFFATLNSPYGYNNYQWTPADLCGNLPDTRM